MDNGRRRRGGSSSDSRGDVLRNGILATVAFVFGVVSVASGRSATELRAELLRHFAADQSDSALALVRDERFATIGVVERLLQESMTASTTGTEDAADSALGHARTVAQLAFEAFGDSLALRDVREHASLPPERARVVAHGWSRLAATRELFDRGSHREAAASVAELDAAVSEAGDPFLSVRGAHEAGRALRAVGDFEGARRRFEIARERARAIDDAVAEERAFAALGMLLQEQDRAPEAADIYREVLSKARTLTDHDMVVWAHTVLGSYHRLRGDLRAARDEYEQGLALARTRAMTSSEVSLLVNLGALRDQLGDGEGALEDLHAAIRLGKSSGTLAHRTELNASLMMASILTKLGRYSQALAIQREALTAATHLGIVDLEAVFRAQIGETYQSLGRPEDARVHLEEALAAFRKAGLPRHIAVVLKDLAHSEAELGRTNEAIRHLEEAIALVESQKLPSVQVELLASLGKMQMKAGDLASAESVLERARDVAGSSGSPLLLGEAERALAGVRAAREDVGGALALLDSSIARGRAYRSQPLLVDALAQRARVLRKAGRREEADELLKEAIALVEEMRGHQSGEAARTGVIAAHASLFAERVAVLYELGAEGSRAGAQEEAFRVSEAGRARGLVDALSGMRVVAGTSAGHLQEQERELAARLAELQSALSRAASSETWNGASSDSLETLVARAGREHRELLDEIGARDPRFGALLGSRPPLSVAEVRTRVLRDGQTLLQYVVGDEESFVFLMGQDRFRLERIDAGSAQITVLVDALRVANADSSMAAARALYEWLIAPVASDLPPQRSTSRLARWTAASPSVRVPARWSTIPDRALRGGSRSFRRGDRAHAARRAAPSLAVDSRRRQPDDVSQRCDPGATARRLTLELRGAPLRRGRGPPGRRAISSPNATHGKQRPRRDGEVGGRPCVACSLRDARSSR